MPDTTVSPIQKRRAMEEQIKYHELQTAELRKQIGMIEADCTCPEDQQDRGYEVTVCRVCGKETPLPYQKSTAY